MKKWISIFLCLSLALALAACGGTAAAPGTTAAQTTTADTGHGLMVGYSRADITPTKPMDLWGYAQMAGERVSSETMDYIYLTCVAITDAEDNTVLMFAADLGSMEFEVANIIRAAVKKATGIPEGHMFFNATHTHSAPDCTKIKAELQKAAVTAAEEALADRKDATMYFGTANTDRISFVRHYLEPNGAVVTDNHGNTSATEFAGHTTEVDEEMRVLQFKREGGKDVLLVNWQCHPHMTGGTQRTSISADIVGAMRMYAEQELDCHFAYYQGGGGNLNPTSRIKSEEANPDHNYKVTGQLMANTAKKALENMTQLEPGIIQVTSEIFKCESNKEDLDLIEAAKQVVNYYQAGHTAAETKPYAESLGLYSYYHAVHLRGRNDTPAYYEMEISTLTIGDFAWSMLPGEFFDTTTKYIRDNSPYTYNFTAAYTNGYIGYFPSLECWEYGSYESDTAKVARGETEKVADRLLEMLDELHG